MSQCGFIHGYDWPYRWAYTRFNGSQCVLKGVEIRGKGEKEEGGRMVEETGRKWIMMIILELRLGNKMEREIVREKKREGREERRGRGGADSSIHPITLHDTQISTFAEKWSKRALRVSSRASWQRKVIRIGQRTNDVNLYWFRFQFETWLTFADFKKQNQCHVPLKEVISNKHRVVLIMWRFRTETCLRIVKSCTKRQEPYVTWISSSYSQPEYIQKGN